MSLTEAEEQQCRELVTTTPDFPKKGITFLSIHPLLANPHGLSIVVEAFARRYQETAAENPSFLVAGLDARGFAVGAAVAHRLGVGFVMVRKSGKLPPPVVSESYALEYGTAAMELPSDFASGHDATVVVLDDLVATGGTMCAACKLFSRVKCRVAEAAAIVELTQLGGRTKIESCGTTLFSLLKYDEL